MGFELDGLNSSAAVNHSQRKDLFEPSDEHEFRPTVREIPISITVTATLSVIEPPFMGNDEVMLSTVETYLLKALTSHKYLQMTAIQVVADTE